MVHIVDTTVASFPAAYGLLITVNAGLTGTVTVTDTRGTQAIITNPVTGGAYRYFGLQGTVTVTASGACDLTVSNLNKLG